MGENPLVNSVDVGSARSILSLVWHVALLGEGGLLDKVYKAYVVSRSALRILVRELPLLLLCISSTSN